MNFSPRVIRHKDAPTYLGVNINYFDRNIRPDLPEIQFGPQMIGYDKIDLDRDGWTIIRPATVGLVKERRQRNQSDRKAKNSRSYPAWKNLVDRQEI